MQRLQLCDFVQPGEHCHYASAQMSAATPRHQHTHDFAEIFFIESGSGIHAINRKMQALEKGLLVLVRPSDFHHFIVRDNDRLRIINIAFPMRSWETLWRKYLRTSDPMKLSVIARHRVLDFADISSLIVAAEHLRNGRRSQLQTDRFLLQAMEVIAASTRQKERANSLPRWLAMACQKIELPANFQDGTPALAELAGRSAEHVARTLRRCTNQTPTDIVNEARLKYAAQRLGMSDEKILNIALDCGLSNLAHFYSLFKKRFGVTPKAYRLLQHRVIHGR